MNNNYYAIIRIYNLDTNEVELFDYRIKEPVDNVYLVDGLVYSITNKKAYVVKLDEITTSKMTVEELDKEFENRLTERIEKIRNEYNFDIKIRKEANLNLKVWDQKTIGETNYDDKCLNGTLINEQCRNLTDEENIKFVLCIIKHKTIKKITLVKK